jgi:hypothetical protein
MIPTSTKQAMATKIAKGRDARMCASTAILASMVFNARALGSVPERSRDSDQSRIVHLFTPDGAA